MRFLIDTDVCSYAMRGHPRVQRHFDSHRMDELAISVITEAELRFGATKSRRAGLLEGLESWLLRFEILELTSSAAEAYAGVRTYLELAGTPIGDLDTLLAAHALARNLVLVTNNMREFRRVPGLRVENWAA